jgi:hypothetical protein
MNKPMTKQVTRPVLEIHNGNSTFRLWVINPGQFAALGKARALQFPHNPSDKTASLIYETISPSGHSATELNLDDAETWAWIQKWMVQGMASQTD